MRCTVCTSYWAMICVSPALQSLSVLFKVLTELQQAARPSTFALPHRWVMCKWAEFCFSCSQKPFLVLCHSFDHCVLGVAPAFASPPSDQTVTDGNRALFTCQTSGAPKPAITWRKGERAVGNCTQQTRTNTPTRSVIKTLFAA